MLCIGSQVVGLPMGSQDLQGSWEVMALLTGLRPNGNYDSQFPHVSDASKSSDKSISFH